MYPHFPVMSLVLQGEQPGEGRTDRGSSRGSSRGRRDRAAGVLYTVAPITTSTLNTKQKIISFLTQAGFGIDVANNMYDSYKKDHPDRSDAQMFESMKKNINLKKTH